MKKKFTSKVKIEFLQDFGISKKGTITSTKKADAEEMEKEGIIKIIKEKSNKEKSNKEKEAHYQSMKGSMERAKLDKKLTDKEKEVFFKLSPKEVERHNKEMKEEDPLIKKYLKRKNIFNMITENELDKLIVGEIPTRKVIFLCCQGSLVENCQIASYNLLLSSSAGAGKDYVASKVLSIIPKEKVQSRTRISPTAFTYWHNANSEPEWTWNGKICYLEDISDGILNHEVFKVMTSSGSSATIVIKQRAFDIDIIGKPVVVTTTASAIPTPEIVRRFEFCSLDESINQTKEIMKRHAEYAKTGKSIILNEEITKSMRFLERKKVKVPFADRLYPYFPENNIMMRTKFVRFLDFIKASAAFHQYQRKEDKDGFLIAQKKDYEIAKIVIEKLSTNRYLVPLTINQQKIMHFFEQNSSFFGNPSAILNKMRHFLALKSLKNNLNLLVSYSLLEKRVEQDVLNRDIEIYNLSKFLKESNDVFTLPSVDKIFKKGGSKL